MVAWPAKVPTLREVCVCSMDRSQAMIGQGESPSAPTMSVVMPWAILRFREGILHETVLGVVVNIDEAGGEDEAAGVDGRLVFFRLQFPDADDVARSDAHVRFVERRAGAIGNARR